MTSNSELKDELLEQVYHENCPGCKVDRDKRMQTGFPLKELIFIWVIVLCVVRQILCNKEDTILWIQKLKIERSYYPLLVLKLIMILASICLNVPDCSECLLEFLTVRHYIASLLPKKFVSSLLRRRNRRCLNLNPEVVAQPFKSVDDPLLILCAGNVSPKVRAPCAIFVDLGKSEEEIMNILFPRETAQNCQTSLNNVGVETICDSPSMKTLRDDNLSVNPVDVCKLEPRMNWKFLDEISDHINRMKGKLLSLFSDESTIKKELDQNIHALATALEDGKSCAGEDATLKELDQNIHALATALEDGKSCAGEDATLVQIALCELRSLSNLFAASQQEAEIPDIIKRMEVAIDWLQSNGPKIDDFLKRYAGHESGVEGWANGDKKNQDEETGDTLQVEPMLEKQTSGGNTQEAKNKKGKDDNTKGDNNKGNNNKGKNIKGKKACGLVCVAGYQRFA
ncbi:uvrD-like Helicase, ATP-binding domain, P-loop containing nucleoside triphosphate hydrolase [Artemisia annua]|uniref:UvrD-like Helicase, ATP-binding domain, P-loop containing nucleoside triphosphate hydrolase n=1 Tax=Artemisia annua TaxID=35608 RepID=A0A2U1MTZ9_ARTAN|nr:uvrD-like Helicase, ATP-binding domain, P-loop containing nucleoside triphosphate hydrolase [Artemisia annua]